MGEDKMKAVRLIEPGRPVEISNIPLPPVGPKDVLVRIKAAGVCHSDVHYRAGVSPVLYPLTLGHEVAGVIEQVGHEVVDVKASDRVCLHYMVTCGDCLYCSMGSEQFCTSGQMLGYHRDGGYAECMEYWADTQRYFEADAEGVLGPQENIYKFVPFVNCLAGFGRKSGSGEPADLVVGRLRKVRDLLIRECAITSSIDSIYYYPVLCRR